MALYLCKPKPKPKSLANPFLIHLFSTSQNGDNDNDNYGNDNNNSSSSSLNSYFSDVKACLRKQTPQNQKTSSSPSRVSSKAASYEEIRKNLAEFRQRSAGPPRPESNLTASQSQPKPEHISFQELYKRNTYNETFASSSSRTPSYESIRESLQQIRAKNVTNNNNNNRGNVGKYKDLFSNRFKDALKKKPENGNNASTVIGGTQELPESVFGKEEKAGVEERMKTKFVKKYSMEELGEKLRKLRPEETESGFSLAELNERLMRLREMEMNEGNSHIGGPNFYVIKQNLVRIEMEKEEKARVQRVNILEGFGGTPEYLRHPRKEHLLEKYFHPDNMSSAEKMKIELAKVREEFKMSESDCGSARVQVAQLTCRIKHLSSVLLKKDKHSRKGLLAMVQRRKRLLKYLRRTDWDSYCLVLSKLGLRDNPDYKSLT